MGDYGRFDEMSTIAKIRGQKFKFSLVTKDKKLMKLSCVKKYLKFCEKMVAKECSKIK